jgi:hypothetical protein
MTRPSQARSRRGLKAEAEELARRGRPPKPPTPAAAAPATGAKPVAPQAGAQPPSENQGKQFGLTTRALVAPMYLAVCGFELPPAAWEEWGVAGAHFAAFYFPNAALHPGYQFVGSTAMMAIPLLLAWPSYAAKRAAARKPKSEAAAPAGPDPQLPPDPTTNSTEPKPAPAAESPPGRTSIGGGWTGLPKT